MNRFSHRVTDKAGPTAAFGCQALVHLVQPKPHGAKPSCAALLHALAGPESLGPGHQWDSTRSAATKQPIFRLSNWNNYALGLDQRLGKAEI